MCDFDWLPTLLGENFRELIDVAQGIGPCPQQEPGNVVNCMILSIKNGVLPAG